MATGAPVFDVCHAGVVLRAVLFVHASVALAIGWAAPGGSDWLGRLSLCILFVLPATLAWLGVACMARRVLAACSRAVYWTAALALGGVLAAAAWWAWRWLRLADLVALVPSTGADANALEWGLAWSVLSGVALAAGIVHWLEQRSRLQAPVAAAARLAELQARIRPHFLFNALNSALALVRLDPARAEAVLEDLADLFRAALVETAADVSLTQELALAQRYLAIEQVRFGDRMRVHWDLDPAAATVSLPPLVLQPLVENAVRHGIEPAVDGGEVIVSTRVQRGRVTILVENSLGPVRDDGAGVPRPGGLGMGLRNVRDRLYLLHDVDLQFDAGPGSDGRWRVRIDLPMARHG